ETKTKLFDKGLRAWDKGKSRQALDLFLEAANLSDSGAQLNLGHFYETGESCRKSVAKALYWYKRAWRQGRQTSACSNVAQLYADTGRKRAATLWWGKAIDHGDGEAALDYARFLLRNKARENRIIRLLKFAIKSRRTTPLGRTKANAFLQIFD